MAENYRDRRIFNLPDNLGSSFCTRTKICAEYGFTEFRCIRNLLIASIKCCLIDENDNPLPEQEENLTFLETLKIGYELTNRDIRKIVNLLGIPNDKYPPRLSKMHVASAYSISVQKLKRRLAHFPAEYHRLKFVGPSILAKIEDALGPPNRSFYA